MKITSIIIIASAMLYPAPAFADYCTDKPTQVIVQPESNVWFTNQNLYNDWCAVPASEQRNRTF